MSQVFTYRYMVHSYARKCCYWLLLLCCLGPLARAGYGQRFAAIGDYGYAGPAEAQVADLIKSWNPEVIITLGDNNYDVGDSSTIDKNIGQYFHDYIYQYHGHYGPRTSSNRFFPSLGNHDYYTRNGEAYRDYFTLPGNGRYYAFTTGDVQFFAINSDPAEPDGIAADSKQGQWLKAQLGASTARWKVVYFHHAPYSSGLHGSTLALRWPFAEWGASVVLAGHDHDYERLVVGGLPYFVNGLGGRSIYGKGLNPLPQSQAFYNTDYGAMQMEATPDSLTFAFYTRRQVLVDSYVLYQAISPTPKLYPARPNPVQESTALDFTLPAGASVELRVLNTLGQQVAGLHQGYLAAGWHHFTWRRGSLPAGLYYVQLLGEGFSQVTRVVAL